VRPFSLQNRMFVATALVSVASLASAIPFIAARITREGEAELTRGLLEAAEQAARHHGARLETLARVTRLIADLPKLKALIDTSDPATVQQGAAEYLDLAGADVVAITNREGGLLAMLGAPPSPESVPRALKGETVAAAQVDAGRLVEQITVPVTVGADVLGTLTLGLALDEAFAVQMKAATGSEVAIVFDRRVLAATAPLPDAELVGAARRGGPGRVQYGDLEYAAVARTISLPGSAAPEAAVLLLRSPTERLLFLRTMQTGLVGAAVLAMALAVVLSYAVARTVARPLASITHTMREMTASGDLTRKIPAGGTWDDEDARVLATTFSALADSLRRFQQEAALKERLSALGRLSTVIAHEVRNPLMIIRASLRALGRKDASEPERAEAVSDIDQEVTRLDRIVREVLEFTRPMPVERSPTDLGALCRDAAAALEREGAKVTVNVPAALPPVSTDGERLRRALVNLLTNARDAVMGRAAGGGLIELRAAAQDGVVVLEVEDTGVGIAPEDLPQVFEPYFSKKRTGTGLGLAITRNIVESLGGTISARSRHGEGTVMRIELPGS
jgi:two-component system, NtrC family, sensor histidine kinase HydH